MLRTRLVVATFLVLACASCSDQTAPPTASPSSSEPTTAPSAPTTSASPDVARYSKKERAAYKTAVTEYGAFTKRNDRFYAAGRPTAAAKRFYQRFAVDWSTAWGDLGQAANNKVTVTGSTKIVSTTPRSIELGGAKGDVIVLRRCLDESGRIVTQDGKKLDQPQFADPHFYTIRLERRPGEDWWRSGIAEQGKTC